MSDIWTAILRNDLEALRSCLDALPENYSHPRFVTTGDTPFLLALRLGHKSQAALLARHPSTDFSLHDSNHFPNRMYAFAYLKDDPRFALGLLDRIESFFPFRASPLAVFHSLPSIQASLSLNLSSWLPIVSRFLPQDTIHLVKTPSYLKLDFRVNPLDDTKLFSYEAQSLVFDLVTGKIWYLRHEKKTFEDWSGSKKANDIQVYTDGANLDWERPSFTLGSLTPPWFPRFSHIPTPIKHWNPEVVYVKNLEMKMTKIQPLLPSLSQEAIEAMVKAQGEAESKFPEDLVDGLPPSVDPSSHSTLHCDTASGTKPYLDFKTSTSNDQSLGGRLYLASHDKTPLT